ncbi:MAG: hypothetical protein GEU86_21155 [Actinophytocola sp.]|nr:hypothetical protein [Actinophytocola sp.]
MSIKVMTWVWDHSPAVGTELLMLLAIADHAGDDGRDAWPSVKRLAQRTRLDERTVRRVLKRLTSHGHLIVDAGGGRRSNHYEIPMTSENAELSTPLADCHLWQNATPGKSPGHPGQSARAALTQLRQGTPDTAVSPEPSSNRPLPPSQGAAEPRLRVVGGGDGGGGIDPRVVEVLTGLGPDWTLTPKQRRRMAPMVAAALSSGWTTRALAEHLAANPGGVKSPAAVLAARLEDLPAPASTSAAERPKWCGECDEATRHRERSDGRVERCPTCHPTRAGTQETGDDPMRHRSRQAPTPHRASSQ